MSANVRRICLNMIVKNEMANIERCLQSVSGHIDCYVIGDTGSSDGSAAFIHAFFDERGINGEIHHFPFENFEQARNKALALARASKLEFDYLLFIDADMELRVEKADFSQRLHETAYEVAQRCGISYWNLRLLKRNAPAVYRGVTHEYLEVEQKFRCTDIWFLDHASGSNRVEKFERDIRLLLAGLAKDPDDARYWFYLAQSYRDSGRHEEAMAAYAKRAEMGGWAEESWFSLVQQARCALALGKDAVFIQLALAAYEVRPTRAEPIFDLAKYYRERESYNAAVAFCRMGLTVTWPEQDSLFIEDFIYKFGFREEFSIAGYYSHDPSVRACGQRFCNELADDPTAPDTTRQLARTNLRWYTQSSA